MIKTLSKYLRENKEAIMKFSILMIIFGGWIGACSYLNTKAGLPDDHPLEEFIEHHIEKNTGWDVDLSGESEEK